MEQSLLNKTIQFLKRSLAIPLLIFLTTFTEIYWAMGSLSERVSSGNPDSSFFDDAYLMSVFTTIILTIVFLLLYFIKNKPIRIIIQLLCLISVWFFWNYTIFVDRESSWSTYLFNEELHYTLSLSFLAIMVLSIVVIFCLKFISKKYELK
ncbi:hypothetical protein [Flavobacterium quisquiliarum]|uniref:Uncharacterized protein n=1 Tax=Flavobacterium quisquiliarum TaxID=1834436 RepID=A0ABV8WBD2_9FLAO|nr:hypothetical protein [Flavobacterium quisquiliarum]MBW1658156.1 hypothetical protein [Flavobacterium quisquiliarum]NWK99927.1 hypothetical protein [Flavobacterium collinsii]